MSRKLRQFVAIVQADPAVESVVGFTGGGSQGGGQTNSGFIFASLKPLRAARCQRRPGDRPAAAQARQVAGCAAVPAGGAGHPHRRAAEPSSQYQYTLQADSIGELYRWAPLLSEALQREPALTDVNSDQQQNGLEIELVIDRDTAARLRLNPAEIDNTLYDAFGQRSVSTIYKALNQYHVIMEVAPEYWQSPDTLKNIWVAPQAAR